MLNIELGPIAKKAVLLRGQRKFQEVMDLVEASRPDLDEKQLHACLLQAFYAAHEAAKKGDGMKGAARKYARELAKKHPDLAAIQAYL